tara:strand:- start:3062 stop:3424 length:363 start_codon:yes stop_codon:yes gene_type:complete
MTSNKAKEIIYELKKNYKVPIIDQVIWKEYSDDGKLKEWSYQQLVNISESKDKHVETVVDLYRERSAAGFKKYGTTLERNDLTIDQWLNHLMEELMDATLYISKIREELNKIPNFGHESK